MVEVHDWQNADPDPETVAALHGAEQLDPPLRFGTAGLRGAIGAGPGKMNRLVVRRATAGLMATLPPGAEVIIGHDARHLSDVFAADAAAVVRLYGGAPTLFTEVLPTPVVAFAVRARNADAGIVVTASHNPPGDNGYKVYLRGGAQVLPTDAGRIETAIAEVPLAPMDLTPVQPSPTGPVVAQYLDAIDEGGPSYANLRIVYTPMHGVGGAVFRSAVDRRGGSLLVVAQQAEPDPDFPTVRFPNPEEPGALDLALALARSEGADVVIAHDPDADRLAVAIPREGDWYALTGDELGALLADELVTEGTSCTSTIVSSSLLSKMALDRGAHHAETLTGFKWLMAGGEPLVFAYEEALGYAVRPVVRDKDGISAALVVLDILATGATVDERLDRVWSSYGRHITSQVSIRVPGDQPTQRLGALMGDLRASPPAQLAGMKLLGMTDFAESTTLPPANVLRFDFEGARVIVRPSGTEPKLKAYLEVIGDRTEEAVLQQQMAELRADVQALLGDG